MWQDFSMMQKASIYGQVAGVVGSAYGAYSQSRSQASALNFQAKIADINARQSEFVAQGELAKGNQQVAALTLKAGQLKSKQRASMAAHGIDLGVGNAAEIQASTDIMKQVDKKNIELNALQSAWGYRMQSSNQSSQAAMSRANASSISPMSSATTSLLGGAKGVADSWYKYSKQVS